VGKRPDDYSKYAEVCVNVLESSKYGDEFAGISYSSKYSKCFEGLPKNMWEFYIHCSLPWEYSTDQSLALKL
jgi:hypothetical protein